jgi:hypothetical protein
MAARSKDSCKREKGELGLREAINTLLLYLQSFLFHFFFLLALAAATFLGRVRGRRERANHR